MDLDYFVCDFVIFSLIDDYDDVFGDLEWVEGEFKLAINLGSNDIARFSSPLMASMLFVYIWLRNESLMYMIMKWNWVLWINMVMGRTKSLLHDFKEWF